VSRLIASFFGTGLILRRVRGRDIGSGTVASVFALALSVAAQPAGLALQIGLLDVASAACLISVRPFAFTEGDPAWVVIDEVAGTFLATLGLGLVPALVGAAVFRLADVFKHRFPGVAAAERGFPGPTGVLADDLVAGLYGLAAGWLTHWLL
jgi:phosphatidylglycerophosphatase A